MAFSGQLHAPTTLSQERSHVRSYSDSMCLLRRGLKEYAISSYSFVLIAGHCVYEAVSCGQL